MPNVSVVCFLASYCVAFMFDAWRLRARNAWTRIVSIGFGLLALDERKVGVLVVINFHEILFIYRYLDF